MTECPYYGIVDHAVDNLVASWLYGIDIFDRIAGARIRCHSNALSGGSVIKKNRLQHIFFIRRLNVARGGD